MEQRPLPAASSWDLNFLQRLQSPTAIMRVVENDFEGVVISSSVRNCPNFSALTVNLNDEKFEQFNKQNRH